MKINPSINALHTLGDAAAGSERASGKGSAPGASSSGSAGSDRVQLSALSTQLAALGTEPGFDRARVEAIKQAIVEGRLGVDAKVVADKMIASSLAMIERGGN